MVTSFGLNRPSSGQYLQKLKNIGAYWWVILYAPAFLSLCKYWPGDGLFRPKLVTNNRNNKTENSCVRRSTYFILFYFNILLGYYVYWTVHQLDSWVKRDQLEVTCFIISLLNAQHVSDVNTPILRNLRLVCWVILWVTLIWFDVCWSYVVVWLGCGIRMQASACIRIPHHHSQTTT